MNPLSPGEVTTFLKSAGLSATAGEKCVVANKPDSKLGTAMRRALFAEGDASRVIKDGKILGPPELNDKLRELGRAPKVSTVQDAPPGLDDEAWDSFCQCTGGCGQALWSKGGQQISGRDRAEALKSGWANYRRANPNLALGEPVLLMCKPCADKAVAAAAPCTSA